MASLYNRLFILTLCAAFTVCTASAPTAHAEGGSLRDFIKARIAKKMVEKAAPDSDSPSSVTEPITRSGDYYFTVPHRDLMRQYRVHVPPSYNLDRATPLVFALHGGGGNMDHMANDENYGLISKSDEAGFIVVFPNGYSKFESGKFATWNAGACCGDARDKKIDDVGFITDIVAHITRQMNIDRNRIYAIGMSNGGMMAHRLACEMSGTFKAVASVTGTDNTYSCDPVHPISVLHIHAKNDTHVLFEGGAGEGSFRDPSKVTDFTSVPQTLSRWIARNHCPTAPQRALSVPGAYCDVYAPCADATQVKVCVTDTGEHSWPGGHKSRGEEPSQAISANDQIWNFFMGLE